MTCCPSSEECSPLGNPRNGRADLVVILLSILFSACGTPPDFGTRLIICLSGTVLHRQGRLEKVVVEGYRALLGSIALVLVVIIIQASDQIPSILLYIIRRSSIERGKLDSGPRPTHRGSSDLPKRTPHVIKPASNLPFIWTTQDTRHNGLRT